MVKGKSKSKDKTKIVTDMKINELKIAPKAPFILMFTGGIIILFGGILVMTMSSAMFTFMRIVNYAVPIQTYPAFFFIDGAVSILCGLIVIMAAILTNTRNIQQLKVWSVIGLSFGIVSLLAFGGFIVGFALTLLGSLVGMYTEAKK
ncbi:MAG: hypothetical protein QW139_01320 [Candidatus Micrarchaeaceae archaeon]